MHQFICPSDEKQNPEIANWLPRYTGTSAKDFSKYVLLVNFTDYVSLFANGTK